MATKLTTETIFDLSPGQISAIRREKKREDFKDDDSCTNLTNKLQASQLEWGYACNFEKVKYSGGLNAIVIFNNQGPLS